MRSQKQNSKFKKFEVLPNIFSEHSGMKLELNQKKKLEETQTREG